MELGDTSDEEAELPTPGALGKGSGVKSGEKEKKPKVRFLSLSAPFYFDLLVFSHRSRKTTV